MDIVRGWNPVDGDPIARSQWLDDIDNIMERQILGTDLHPRAGISRRQLSDRFSVVPYKVTIVPHEANTLDSAGLAPVDRAIGSFVAGYSTYMLPNSGSEYLIPILPVILPVGSQAWLLGIASRIRQIEAGGSAQLPQLNVYKGSDLLGGGPQIHATADRWYNLMEDPNSATGLRALVDVQNGEYLYAGISQSANGGAAARVQGWDLFVLLKIEHSQ